MILGIDVSTSITGYCILDADGEIIRADAWDTRNKKKFENEFKKATLIKEGLCEFKAQYPIEKVFIEKPFMFFWFWRFLRKNNGYVTKILMESFHGSVMIFLKKHQSTSQHNKHESLMRLL